MDSWKVKRRIWEWQSGCRLFRVRFSTVGCEPLYGLCGRVFYAVGLENGPEFVVGPEAVKHGGFRWVARVVNFCTQKCSQPERSTELRFASDRSRTEFLGGWKMNLLCCRHSRRRSTPRRDPIRSIMNRNSSMVVPSSPWCHMQAPPTLAVGWCVWYLRRGVSGRHEQACSGSTGLESLGTGMAKPVRVTPWPWDA